MPPRKRKKKYPNIKSNKKKPFVFPVKTAIASGGIILSAVGFAVYESMDISLDELFQRGKTISSQRRSTITFEQAQIGDADTRQLYLDELINRLDIPDYIESVTYKTGSAPDIGTSTYRKDGKANILTLEDGKTKLIQGNKTTFMWTRGQLKDFGTGVTRPRIEVFPVCFSPEGEERSFIFDFNHELKMAELHRHGLDKIDYKILTPTMADGSTGYFTAIMQMVCELEAYESDIERAKMLGYGSHLDRALKMDYLDYYFKLWNPTSLPKPKIDSLKRTYKQPWFSEFDEHHSTPQGDLFVYLNEGQTESRVYFIPPK